MTDDEFEDLINEAGARYNLPAGIPREEMWEAIQAELRQASPAVVSIGSRLRPGGWARLNLGSRGMATAAAALLILGIGVGRMSVPRPLAPSAGAATVISDSEVPLRMVTRQHLADTEALLSMISTDARTGRIEGDVGPWAARLLLETRLLMTSEVGQNVAVAELLRDLELILVQVAGLSGDRARRAGEDMELITEGMNDQNVIMRIRALLPAAGI